MPIYSNFSRGNGISKYDQGSFDATSNLDVHSEVGSAKAQLVLESESTTPNENCIAATVPNGDVYFFSTESGKTWKRQASNDAYSLENTNANGSHTGCKYFDGKLYYAASNKLGHFDLSSTWTDSFATLSATPTYCPMEVLNLSLWIGAGAFIDEVDDSGTFAANALDLPAGYDVTALGAVGFDLLIGTIRDALVSHSKVFVWDTISSSWTVEDDLDEIGVNTIIKADNQVFLQAGTAGQIYSWNGSTAQKFRRIRGVTTSATNAHYKTVTHEGKPLLAIGSDVYSIHRVDRGLPHAIVHEYTSSTGNAECLASGDGQLLVSNGTNINKIGTDRATATIDTPITPITEEKLQGKVIVTYDSLPSGSSIGISTQINSAGSYTSQTTTTDTVKRQVYFDGRLLDAVDIQARITLTPNGANSPVIKQIEVM
jgi:hypothetical protein